LPWASKTCLPPPGVITVAPRRASGILVTFSGLPYTTACFFLDNGIANLAGALAAGGHDVLILDYSTPSVLSRVLTEDVRTGLRRAWELTQAGTPEQTAAAETIYHRMQEHIDASLTRFQQDLLESISCAVVERKADFVGFKLWLGRGVQSAVQVARRLKQRFPGLKIYGGGPVAQLFTDQALATGGFDALAAAEAETIICDLAAHAVGGGALHRIPNLAFREGGRTVTTPLYRPADLDELPPPVYDEDVYPAAHREGDKIRVVTLDESRGCNRKCAFCTHGTLGGRPVRLMSVNRVVDRIADHIRSLKTHVFNLGGSSVPPSLAGDIATTARGRGLEMLAHGFTNAADVDTSRLPEYRRAGLFSLFYGLESLDAQVLRQDYDKRADPAAIARVVRETLDAGVYVTGSIIFPAPRETVVSARRTLRGLAELFGGRPNGSVVVFYPGLMTHSTWSLHPERYAIDCPDMEAHFRDLMSCEVRHFLPTTMWQSFNYSMGGRSQPELARLADKFARALNRRRVTTNAMGDSAMLAFTLGRRPADFERLLARLFLTGDAAGLTQLTQDINRAISRRPPEPPVEWTRHPTPEAAT